MMTYHCRMRVGKNAISGWSQRKWVLMFKRSIWEFQLLQLFTIPGTPKCTMQLKEPVAAKIPGLLGHEGVSHICGPFCLSISSAILYYVWLFSLSGSALSVPTGSRVPEDFSKTSVIFLWIWDPPPSRETQPSPVITQRFVAVPAKPLSKGPQLMDEELVHQLFEHLGAFPLRAKRKALGSFNQLPKKENTQEGRWGFWCGVSYKGGKIVTAEGGCGWNSTVKRKLVFWVFGPPWRGLVVWRPSRVGGWCGGTALSLRRRDSGKGGSPNAGT